jgi:two-component system chemotaxis response regulator CheY
MRNVIKKVISHSGFQMGDCWEAGNGQEALDVLDSQWIDLILSDIHMPVMDGYGLLRALNAKEGLRDLPVVLITTESNQDRIQEAMTLGAKGYIRKPFRPEEICKLLRQVMGESDEHQLAGSDEDSDF